MRPNFVSVQLLGVRPRAQDKEEMMNFLKWLSSLNEGISFYPMPGAKLAECRPDLADGPLPIEEIFDRGYHWREPSLEQGKNYLDFDSRLLVSLKPQWLTVPESDIYVEFQNWADSQYVLIFWMSTLLQFSQPKRSEELAQNAPDFLRLAENTHLRYKPFLTIIGPKDRMAIPYQMDKPRLYAEWVTIIGAELLRRRKITLPKAPDTLTVEDLDGDVIISSKLSYPEFVKQGFSEEEKSFWKSIGAIIRYNPKLKEPKDDSETYIVKDSPEGLYLESLDKEKFFGEKRD